MWIDPNETNEVKLANSRKSRGAPRANPRPLGPSGRVQGGGVQQGARAQPSLWVAALRAKFLFLSLIPKFNYKLVMVQARTLESS